MTTETTTDNTTEPIEGVPAAFQEVAAQHGRDKLMLVYNAGMVQQALLRLNTLADKHRSSHGLHAVQVIAAAFNQLASTLTTTKGWTAEELALVERDIGLAIAGKLVDANGRKILDS